MKSESTHRSAEFLASNLEGADSAQIAETVVATWHDIDAALTPIIGQRGVQALFDRSIHLTARTHAWLSLVHGGNQTAMNLAALKLLLAEQPRAAASSAADLLLRTFHELLTSLIGPSLTERLLRSVATPVLSSPSTTDTSP